LWIWIKLFGNTDQTIKFLSVLFGSFAVIVAYFCGKHFEYVENKKMNFYSKTGFIFSVLLSVSAIAIYYSQQVRPYSLIILLSTFVLLFILKLINTPNNKNLGAR
jgi:uncharacterized membrane protein